MVYDADNWFLAFVFFFTGFVFWFLFWLGLWSTNFIINLVKDSMK